MERPPRNPYLADSDYPIGHGTCAQQDSTELAGPIGPSATMGDDDLDYAFLGPGQFGMAISGPYPDGRRVIWNNGSERITKIDYDTFEVLATIELPGKEQTTRSQAEAAWEALDNTTGDDSIAAAMDLALKHLVGLQGIYFVLDRDNTLFLGMDDGIVAFAEADPDDRASEIVIRDRWDKPKEVEGRFVGVNITSDGWLVLSTEYGWIVCVKRDFSEYHTIRLDGAEAEDAAGYTERMAAERGNRGYGWVRTSICTDDADGIYVSSRDRTHKVVWRDACLSTDEADGAWTARYRNGAGFGSGTTPCLMGFGDVQDRFVVIGDGDEVVNITLLWRDEIPEDWEQLSQAPSRRIAGMGRADMGDRSATAVQTEQSITVSGYGAMTVNNEPASVPAGYPSQANRLFVFWLGHHPEYTPVGLHKFEWDPTTRHLTEAWVNTEVSSPNAVPYVSEGSDLVYTCGVRDRQWTMEGVRWSTGEAMFHYVLGGSRFNTLGAGVILDQEGRLMFGTTFGKVRVDRLPHENERTT
jgi:hypothetical protein